MLNSENIISYSATVLALVGVYRWLHYVQDITIATLLGQAVQKLPPNVKDAWGMPTVENKCSRSTLIELNDWLKEKAEAQEMMKVTSLKPEPDDIYTTITKTKTAIKVFASTSKAHAPTVGRSVLPTQPVKCTARKEIHPLWRCSVFRGKTPTQRAKVVADNKLCFLCLNGQHFFRQGPKPRKCTVQVCSSSHNVMLHGVKVFPPKPLSR